MRMSSNSMRFSAGSLESLLSTTQKKTDHTGQKSSAFMETLAALQKEETATQGESLKYGLLCGGKRNPIIVTTKKILPDGTILIMKKKDGKIVEETKKKPHMLPIYDHVAGEVKMEPMQNVFEGMI